MKEMQINRNKSMHSEIGPLLQKPIQRTKNRPSEVLVKQIGFSGVQSVRKILFDWRMNHLHWL